MSRDPFSFDADCVSHTTVNVMAPPEVSIAFTVPTWYVWVLSRSTVPEDGVEEINRGSYQVPPSSSEYSIFTFVSSLSASEIVVENVT